MMTSEQAVDRRIAAALGAYVLAVVAALLVAGTPLTYDDGFYYFKIAQQLAHGAGSTFDGLHPTNGYHPLWLLCLALLCWFVPAPAAALAAGTFLQGLFLAGSTGLLYLIARLSFGRFAASLASIVWVVITIWIMLSGLEFGLHALGVLAMIYLFLRSFASPPSAHCYLALGVLASLTFLARIDTLLLAGVLGVSLARRELRTRTRASYSRLLSFGAPIAVVVLLYGGVNLWLFGHPLPISGAIKRSWSAELLAADPRYQVYGWLAAKAYLLLWPLVELGGHLRDLLARDDLRRGGFSTLLYPLSIALGTFGMSALYLAGMFGSRWPVWHSRFERSLRQWGPFVAFSWIQLALYAAIYHGGLSRTVWYYVVQPCLAVIVLAFLAELLVQRTNARRELHRGRGWVWQLVSVGLVVGWLGTALYPFWNAGQLYEIRRLGLTRRPLQEAIQWVNSHAPAGALIGAWNAGTIGYTAERRVVNLDGLVNSWEYGFGERYDLCSYWRKTEITYLVDVFDGYHAISSVPTRSSYAACVNWLELVWADRQRGDGQDRMTVFRIQPPVN